MQLKLNSTNQDYAIILDIIMQVTGGANLTEEFNFAVNSNPNVNTGRVKDICYGFFRCYYQLKYYFNCLVKKSPGDYRLELLIKIAFYEILFTQRPQYAIVNEIVNFVKLLLSDDFAKNFANAVIRNFIRKKDQLQHGDIEVIYNMPMWIIDKLNSDYNFEYTSILNHLNSKPMVGLRVNYNRISRDEYANLLNQANIEYTVYEESFILLNSISVEKIPLFNDGVVSIQDIAAQQLNKFYDFSLDSYILDACAAPGGKTCQILENYSIDLVALDINQKRVLRIKDNLSRLKLDARIITGDATKLDWWDYKLFDSVIADVPCSATGTIKRNPDIKVQRSPTDIKNFVQTQRLIVNNLWNILKPNGYLIYITCSIFKEENQGNISYFLSKLPNIKFIKDKQILPTKFNDGFYYCLLQKIF